MTQLDELKPKFRDVEVDIVSGVATVTGLDEGYKIEWDTAGLHDQVHIEGTDGKFDIGRFGMTEGLPTADQQFDFTVQITDYDGDTATASFNVVIDGTGIFDDDTFDLMLT